MRTILLLSMILAAGNAAAQTPSATDVETFGPQLDDVMEITDTAALKLQLVSAEKDYRLDTGELNKARLGIIYHETALNLGFFSKTEYKGYAEKSFDVLSELYRSPATSPGLLPFVAAYRASALALVSAETRQLDLLSDAFKLFDDAVEKYSGVSYVPEFLRGSVAENLPWFFFSKRKFAKRDFQSIIDRQAKNENYAPAKIMSFTYWAWANQHRGKKHRALALNYLDKAIALDPEYKAGRKRAEELKAQLQKQKRK